MVNPSFFMKNSSFIKLIQYWFENNNEIYAPQLMCINMRKKTTPFLVATSILMRTLMGCYICGVMPPCKDNAQACTIVVHNMAMPG